MYSDGDTLRHSIRDPGDDLTGIAVADQNNVVEIVGFEIAHDIGDMRVEADGGTDQVGSIGYSCQGGCVNLVFSLLEERYDPLPAPAAMPGSRNQYEYAHRTLPPYRCVFAVVVG
ncbi:hypothetical protein GCM10009813_20600 [Brevibacterium marinum]